MQMNASSIVNQKAEWEKLGVKLPAFDHAAMTAATKEHPIWVHFGAGNIFRGFIAALQQRLLNEGLADRGIIAADTFDYDIIDKIYTPYDNLTMNVTLNPDGTTSREIIGSVAEGLRANSADAEMMARFKQIFTDPGLQMISFTITEKGYALYRPDGSLMPVVQAHRRGPCPRTPRHEHGRRPAAGAFPERCRPAGRGQHGQLLSQRREAADQRHDRCQGLARKGLRRSGLHRLPV